MKTLKEKLNLHNIGYISNFKIELDNQTGLYIGTISNADLKAVITNKDKEELKHELNEVALMHCYMTSIDAIHNSLSFLNVKNFKTSSEKVDCSYLVPVMV